MPKEKIVTLINIPQITNQAVLTFALTETKKYFSEFNQKQPPIPDNVNAFVPGRLLITEIESDEVQQGRVGRIQFLRDDGTSYSDQKWRIA